MDYFEEYFKFVGVSEAPMCFHRWCAIGTLSAMVGREVYFPFGHKPIYPNHYILLMGAPGTRKSTAIGIAKTVLERAGYTTFAKEQTSRERFFVDMIKRISPDDVDLEALILDVPSEVTIANGEFLDFIGQGNMSFLTALTNLWDNLPFYEHPKLHGRSVFIHQPTVNILGGATVKGLGLAIPPEALGTGILSRLLLIHSEMTDIKIAFPAEVLEDSSDEIVETLLKIRTDLKGKMDKSAKAEIIMDKMYKNYPGLEDGRLADFASRRFTHLLKLSMLIALSRNSQVISEEDALKANTILNAAERKMPKALGEFGKSKFSDVSNTIMEVLGKAHKPVSHSELWKFVAKDLSESKDLGTIMKNLLSAEKIQVITLAGKQGYLPLHREHKEWDRELLLEDYLTAGE